MNLLHFCEGCFPLQLLAKEVKLQRKLVAELELRASKAESRTAGLLEERAGQDAGGHGILAAELPANEAQEKAPAGSALLNLYLSQFTVACHASRT